MSTTLVKPTRVLPDGLLYIDGSLRPAEMDRTYDNVGPWTGQIVGQAADASAADVQAAIAAARRAFDTTDWSTSHDKRFALVKKLHELFVANRSRLVDIARHEVGAPLVAVQRIAATSPMGIPAICEAGPYNTVSSA